MTDIKVEALSEIDKILEFGKGKQIFTILNYFLILAKQHIYSCRNKGFPPSLKTYLAKVSLIFHQKKLRLLNQMVSELFTTPVKWKKFIIVVVVIIVVHLPG